MKSLAISFAVVLVVLVSCDNILVVLDNANLLKTHSKWINLLAYPRNN